jgi:hypothetical protein
VLFSALNPRQNRRLRPCGAKSAGNDARHTERQTDRRKDRKTNEQTKQGRGLIHRYWITTA